jgi:hypothetical protein
MFSHLLKYLHHQLAITDVISQAKADTAGIGQCKITVIKLFGFDVAILKDRFFNG